MVRVNVAVVALIGATKAIKINNKFVIGDFDDDQAVIDRLNVQRDNEAKQAKDFDNNVLGVKQIGQSMMQVKSRSDPIESSAGHDPDDLPRAITEEQKYEEYLSKLKPKNFTFEHGADEHPETQDSIAWAEKEIGAKLVIPAVKDPRISEDQREEIFDYDDDADVTSTLKSAHQAELIYGLHKSQSNRGYYHGGEGEDRSRYYRNGTKKLGLNGEEEHNSEKYTPTWGGNSTHDAYNREYGTPKPDEKPRNSWYGNYTSHFYDEDAKKDWWRHLIKDKDHLSGDGMVSITLGIPDYKLDGSRPYLDVVKEVIEQQAAKDNQAKTSPEDRAYGKEIKNSVTSSEEPMSSPSTPPSNSHYGSPPSAPAASPPAASPPADSAGPPPELDPSIATVQKEQSESASLSESAMPSTTAAAATPAVVQKSQPAEEDDGRPASAPPTEAQPKLENPPKVNDIVAFMGTKASVMGEMLIDGEQIAVPEVGGIKQQDDGDLLDQDI